MTSFLEASAALAEGLLDDPFSWAITEDFGNDIAARKQALRRYFHYSLEEAERTGRCVVAPDPSLGAAVWLLPRSSAVEAAESCAKSKYLASALGARGMENYYHIVRYHGAAGSAGGSARRVVSVNCRHSAIGSGSKPGRDPACGHLGGSITG